jgi:hypothetical protein
MTFYAGGVVRQERAGYSYENSALLECGKMFITRLYCNTDGSEGQISAQISEVYFPGSSGLHKKTYFSVPVTSTRLHVGFSLPYFIDLTADSHCSAGNQVALTFIRQGGWSVPCEADVVVYK